MGLAPDTPNAERGFEFVLSVVTMICVYVWCRADGQGAARPIGRWPLWVAIFSPIAMPLYFFRARTKRAALLAIAKAIA
jgi:hypothetical protein